MRIDKGFIVLSFRFTNLLIFGKKDKNIFLFFPISCKLYDPLKLIS